MIYVILKNTIESTIDKTKLVNNHEFINCFNSIDEINNCFINQILPAENKLHFCPTNYTSNLLKNNFVSDCHLLITQNLQSNLKIYHIFFIEFKVNNQLIKFNPYTNNDFYQVLKNIEKITKIEIN